MKDRIGQPLRHAKLCPGSAGWSKSLAALPPAAGSAMGLRHRCGRCGLTYQIVVSDGHSNIGCHRWPKVKHNRRMKPSVAPSAAVWRLVGDQRTGRGLALLIVLPATSAARPRREGPRAVGSPGPTCCDRHIANDAFSSRRNPDGKSGPRVRNSRYR